MAKSNNNIDFPTGAVVRPGDLLTAKEAAAYLRIQPSTLYKLVHKRKIGCFKPNGKLLYFLRTDLAAWAQQYRQASQSEVDSDAATLLSRARRGALDL